MLPKTHTSIDRNTLIDLKKDYILEAKHKYKCYDLDIILPHKYNMEQYVVLYILGMRRK